MTRSTCLGSLYPRIRAWERIRLLLAAQARKDDAEYQRLFSASPIRTWYFSEHLLAEQALHVLTLTYITEQLDAVACMFFALFQVSHHEREADLSSMADTCAYFFTVNTQAWKSFCSELDVPAAELVAANQGGWFLPYCEEMIPRRAPTAEELAIHQSLPGPLITPIELTQRWRQRLQQMVQSTPLDKPESNA